mgnify:CR=1 FL=1
MFRRLKLDSPIFLAIKNDVWEIWVIYILNGGEVFLHIPDNNFIIMKLTTFFKESEEKRRFEKFSLYI